MRFIQGLINDRTYEAAHQSRNAPRRTGEAQQKGGKEPVRQRSLTLVEQRVGQIVDGALAALAPVAFAPGPIVVRAPWINIVALASGTLEAPILPPPRMDVGLTRFSAEELVDI